MSGKGIDRNERGWSGNLGNLISRLEIPEDSRVYGDDLVKANPHHEHKSTHWRCVVEEAPAEGGETGRSIEEWEF